MSMTDTHKPPQESVADVKEWRQAAWRARDTACRCDHNEYCAKCFPIEHRTGGQWDQREDAAMARAAQPPQAAQPEAEREPVAWLIEFQAQGQPRKNVALHNAVADYRDIDPNARSTPLYATLADPARPEAEREALTDERIARRWFDAEYGPGHTVAPGYARAFARAIEADVRAALAAPAQPGAQELPSLSDEQIDSLILRYVRVGEDGIELHALVRAAVAQEREQQRKIIDAAQAVVEGWDAPIWKKGGPTTAIFINRLRAALKADSQGGAS